MRASDFEEDALILADDEIKSLLAILEYMKLLVLCTMS